MKKLRVWMKSKDPDGDYIYGPEDWHEPEDYVYRCRDCGEKYSMQSYLDLGRKMDTRYCPRCKAEHEEG